MTQLPNHIGDTNHNQILQKINLVSETLKLHDIINNKEQHSTQDQVNNTRTTAQIYAGNINQDQNFQASIHPLSCFMSHNSVIDNMEQQLIQFTSNISNNPSTLNHTESIMHPGNVNNLEQQLQHHDVNYSMTPSQSHVSTSNHDQSYHKSTQGTSNTVTINNKEQQLELHGVNYSMIPSHT